MVTVFWRKSAGAKSTTRRRIGRSRHNQIENHTNATPFDALRGQHILMYDRCYVLVVAPSHALWGSTLFLGDLSKGQAENSLIVS